MRVMSVQGLLRVRTLAAESWTYCSLSRALLGSPQRIPLQESRKAMKTWIMSSATESEGEGQSLEVVLR